MKATIPQFRFNRLMFFSLSASVLVFFGWNVREKIVPTPSLPFTITTPTTEVVPQRLPFAFDDVVRYFEDALGFRAQEHFANQVVFHGGNSPDNLHTITVTRRGAEVLVTFNVIDDYGMQLLREFFEAPFFQRSESQQFYALLTGREVTRTLHLPRFNLFFQYSSPGIDANISMIFSPKLRSLSGPN